MKFRTDYVTNSSSSSYVCEICGRTESGWDICLNECDMMSCVNEHIFCCHEALEMPSKKEMVKTILENEWNKIDSYNWSTGTYEHNEYTEEELLEFDEDSLMCDFMSEGGYWNIPEIMCPICQFIEYSEDDLSAYLLKEFGVSRYEVFEEVKKLNKRRKKLYENEYITYVCKKFDLNPTEIVSGWKERFGSYSNFRQWLCSN